MAVRLASDLRQLRDEGSCAMGQTDRHTDGSRYRLMTPYVGDRGMTIEIVLLDISGSVRNVS